jgi:hypothetical protein
MKFILATTLFLALTGSLWAIEDTPENRAKEADAYLQAVPAKELVDSMTEKLASSVPEAQRDLFKSMMTKHLDLNALVEAQKAALVKVFTAGEIESMKNFYGSADGKSVLKKMSSYMAELMPTVQSQLMKAAQAAAQEVKASNGQPSNQ